ncbi:MAG TPA: oxygenase MpaB family protein [Jatrophihabitans sp.]|jgi:uncharacterized protein (DUF2236 family)
MTDVGYFGPDSVTWRVHGEPATMVGGLRALLLQALHPDAMQLLYARSNFQDDPWARLQRTVRYVVTVSFGARAEVDAAAAQVRSVHHRLGIADPGQLAWVHACQVDSFLSAARAAGVRLGPAEEDRYVAEQAVAASLVEVPAELTPQTVDELDRYMARMRSQLACTPEAREAARTVIAPSLPVPAKYVVPARFGWTIISLLAVGLLPDWARRMYRVPPIPGTTFVATGGMRVLRRTVQMLPDRFREGPAYRAAKARVAETGDVSLGSG